MKTLFKIVFGGFFALFFSIQAAGQCSLSPPLGFKTEVVTSCYIQYSWNAVSGAQGYRLKYKVSSASSWTTVDVGNVTSYTVTGLTPSTEYKAKIAALCANGSEGSYTLNVSATTQSCSTPLNFVASSITTTSAVLSWTAPCGENSFKINWRKKNTSSWTKINNVSGTSYTLTGLSPSTTYEAKIQAKCGGGNNSSFSKVITFTTLSDGPQLPGKNVLFIIIDDARYDSYDVTGGPSFFPTPNISRIANEGANFKLSFPVLSMCAPSRASVATGVYPHIHDVTDNTNNGITDSITIITLPQILKAHGYYTGLIGKWHINEYPQPGYDYWLHCDRKDYFNAKYNYNGVFKKIAPHQTDVLTDSAINFIQKRPKDKPFFLWLGYRVPHKPYVPRTADDGLFDTYDMPFPSNYKKYEKNYPEFLYDCHSAPDSAKLVSDYRGYFELLQGLETRLGDLWAVLEEEGIMDSTLIIFTSDNGYLMGEHKLMEKRLAYEESIKVPLFMRHPKSIKAGKVLKKVMALNIDIAPTILDFAGIPQTYGMQGVSLLDMIDGTVERTEMLYQFYSKECVPDIRAIRSLNFKYVVYNCDQPTEEFFDLNNDKKENTNQINNPLYADSVEVYRNKLTYWRNYYQDFSWGESRICSLSNVQRIPVEEGKPLTWLRLFPNPVEDDVRLHFITEHRDNGSVFVFNAMGQLVYQERFINLRELVTVLPSSQWLAGAYRIIVQHGNHVYQEHFVKQ